MPIDPLADIPVDLLVAAVPKADLHLHQEAKARLDNLAARRLGRPRFDWRAWARHVLDTPPGMGRLEAVYQPDATFQLDDVPDTDPDVFISRVADVLEEGAADGAVLIEVRFGREDLLRPELLPMFREAERRVQQNYPSLRAEAIGFLNAVDDLAMITAGESHLQACLKAAREGLGGVDFRVDPYDTPAGPAAWEIAYGWAQRAADAGLGITVHAGEFSTANLDAALRMPGVTRLGHALYAASDPRLLDQLAESGIIVEFSLTCNVILGAVPSYEEHPIRRFVERGIPVTLNTDLPVHVGTTIGREYAVAAALGFSHAELLGFTRNAVRASFTTAERRANLLAELNAWEDEWITPDAALGPRGRGQRSRRVP
jgi:adenosine deaminase